jgi:lipoprotein-anchoring transpeptidase ErfK/SrfK
VSHANFNQRLHRPYVKRRGDPAPLSFIFTKPAIRLSFVEQCDAACFKRGWSMRAARFLLLVGVAGLGLAVSGASAESVFNLPFRLPGAPPAANPQTYLPPDADPNYSTPGGFDEDVDMSRTTRKEVADPTGEPAGTLTINTRERKLYLSLGAGRALQYGIGVGRQGFAWKGKAEIGRKAFWPGWTPPPEMLARQRDLPVHMDGGMENPLGARALYLFEDKKDTLFRIHGTNEPNSIGKAVSSGCIRMLDSDVIDLYGRVAKGTPVVVL